MIHDPDHSGHEGRFILLRVDTPRRAASSSYRRKPVSRGLGWILPYPVRDRRVKQGMTGQKRKRYPAACCGVVHSSRMKLLYSHDGCLSLLRYPSAPLRENQRYEIDRFAAA